MCLLTLICLFHCFSLPPALDFTPDLFSVFVCPSIYAPLFGPTAIRLQRFSPPLVQQIIPPVTPLLPSFQAD